MTGVATRPDPVIVHSGLFNAADTGVDPWTQLEANAELPAGDTVLLGPPPPLDTLAAESAWAVQHRDDGSGIVSLRGRGRRFDAHVRHDVTGPAAHVEIERRGEMPAPVCARAAAWLLLATTARMRHVRASVHDAAGGGFELRLEAACSGDAGLDAALEALAVAFHLCVPETLHLLDDEDLAARCLAHWPPVVSTSTP